MQKPTVPGSELLTRCIGWAAETEGYTGKDLDYVDGEGLKFKSQ